MRVLDSNPIGVTTMGRKKRLRKSERQNSDTSDESAADVQCSHLNKSVNLNVVRKALKFPIVVGKCQPCSANNDSTQKKSMKNDAGSLCTADPLASAVAESPVDCEPHSVCICLQCGHQGCDRYSTEKHALQHFQSTTQCGAHNLVLNLSSFQAWCYACDNHVPVDGSKKVLECVEFIYRMSGQKDSFASNAKRNDAMKEIGLSNETSVPELRDGATGIAKDDKNRHKVAHLTPVTPGVLLGFPKVKGLNNLGNTCFFNAVVQNLGQTHLLETQLREFIRKGHSIDLMASPLETESKPYTDDEMEEKEEVDEEEQETRKPECLSLSLGESGQLTQSMLGLFDEMKSTGKQNSISPSALFGQVCKKAPRFKGFQQQDSHELLRYLLDAIRGEEIKRAQTAILRAFKLPENPKAKDVSDELKPKVKAYGRHVKHTFVDSVFGGHLISTVICQACHTPFQVFEPFLDLSLPLSEEKPFKSTGFHGGGSKTKEEGKKKEGSVDQLEGNQSGVNQQRPSKHLTKKERRLAKKKASKGPSKKKIQVTSSEEKTTAAGDLKEPVSSNFMASSVEAEDARDEKEKLLKNGGEDDDSEEGPENAMEEEEEEEVKEEVKENEERGLNDAKANGLKSEEDEDGEEAACPEVKGQLSAVESKGFQGTSPLGSDESSDADVEDNIESDASRYQGMAKSIDTLPDPLQPLADSTSTQVEERELGHSTNDNLCLGQVDHEESLKCDKDGCSEAGKVRDMVRCNGGDKIVTDMVKDFDSLHTSDEPVQKELQTTRQKLEKRLSQSDVRRKAGIAATKTLVPRERPTQDWSILSVLYQFTSPELLSGNNMYICAVCNKRNKNTKTTTGSKMPVMTIASKQLLIFSPPAVLTLHLKRFQQVGFGLRKITRHVEFSDMLDLAPYCSSLCENVRVGGQRVLYSLFGIVEHSGTLRSGHYTAYVKVRHSNPNAKQFLQTLSISQLSIDHLVSAMNAFATTTCNEDCMTDCTAGVDDNTKESVVPPGKWFYISDSNVSEVRNVSNVFSCQAYLLFYERVE